MSVFTIDIACTLRKNTHRVFLRRVPLERIASALLSKHYTLSIALVGDARAKRLNNTYRKKNYVPNVLSFSLAKDEGEIVLNIRKAEREARVLGVSPVARIAHLYVHGLLHLKGMRHGAAMDTLEKNILRRFNR
ncbi:rRNA maturation RNase YbeY [Candidatus Kaiserbacteria bacterium RIFCSPHIGHO2_01_FULL_50_13]|nr:MAG: rRNA maturation RNase YbeY [Candidatus Kaiserbacteria bacterium RIFCSPHIGHO2_01_FULL_50_13]OGG81577.1 MAG: rRNA maturation RNase YbeY [Candidatus Kaiserbacteria bacterium RIFCSPLOWO2_02_FULL_51_13]